MSPLRALGGRVPFATAIEPRVSTQQRRHTLPPGCLTESFDGPTSFDAGPDVSWEQCGYTTSAGTTAGRVFNNRFGLYVPVEDTSANAYFAARTAAIGSDVTVTMDIVGIPDVPSSNTPGEALFVTYYVGARMDDSDLCGSMPFPTMVYARVDTATFLSIGGPTWDLTVGWYTPFYSASFPTGILTMEGQPTSLGLSVTGEPGSTLVIEGSVDGAVFNTTTHQDIMDAFYTDYNDDPTFFPRGERAGFLLGAGVEFLPSNQFSEINDEVAIDNWQACPA